MVPTTKMPQESYSDWVTRKQREMFKKQELKKAPLRLHTCEKKFEQDIEKAINNYRIIFSKRLFAKLSKECRSVKLNMYIKSCCFHFNYLLFGERTLFEQRLMTALTKFEESICSRMVETTEDSLVEAVIR